MREGMREGMRGGGDEGGRLLRPLPFHRSSSHRLLRYPRAPASQFRRRVLFFFPPRKRRMKRNTGQGEGRLQAAVVHVAAASRKRTRGGGKIPARSASPSLSLHADVMGCCFSRGFLFCCRREASFPPSTPRPSRG